MARERTCSHEDHLKAQVEKAAARCEETETENRREKEKAQMTEAEQQAKAEEIDAFVARIGLSNARGLLKSMERGGLNRCVSAPKWDPGLNRT